MPVTTPLEFTMATAVAPDPTPLAGVIVTAGAEVYPAPPLTIAIVGLIWPVLPFRDAVAVATM